uniref:Uncharacterized protein n=1 Tax=Arundo donax TaxID=35708 RepID=A0A0A9BQ40_ARUDO
MQVTKNKRSILRCYSTQTTRNESNPTCFCCTKYK